MTMITTQHLEHAALAKQGKTAPVTTTHRARPLAYTIYRDDSGFPWLVFKGGTPMPATDVEADLWDRLKATKEAK